MGRFSITRKVSWTVALILALANIALFLIAKSSGIAHAGDSFGGGDCWRPGTPLLCQEGYIQGQFFYFRVYTWWGSPSQIRSRAEPGLNDAKTRWNVSTGPQIFVSPGSTNTPYNNIDVQEDPPFHSGNSIVHNTLHSSVAVTVNWSWNGSSYYICFTNPCLIYFSEVYVNGDWDRYRCNLSTDVYSYVYAHEFGHVLGLNDHGSGNILMNNYWPDNCNPQTSARAPTSTEIGILPPCSGAPPGIRCVYNWPN